MPFILVNKHRGGLSAAATVIFATRDSAARAVADARASFFSGGGCTVKKGIHITSVTRPRRPSSKRRGLSARSELVLIARIPSGSRIPTRETFRKLLTSSLKKVSGAGLDSVIIFCPAGLESSSGSFSLYGEARDLAENLFPEITVFFAAGDDLSGDLSTSFPHNGDVDSYLATNYSPVGALSAEATLSTPETPIAAAARPAYGVAGSALITEQKNPVFSAGTAESRIASYHPSDLDANVPSGLNPNVLSGLDPNVLSAPRKARPIPKDRRKLLEYTDGFDADLHDESPEDSRPPLLDQCLDEVEEYAPEKRGKKHPGESRHNYKGALTGAADKVPFDSFKAPHLASFNAISSIDDNLTGLEDGFSTILFKMIDARGLSDPECYRRANIDRKLFSKIRNNPDYHPRKDTVLAFCLALRLTPEESSTLLASAGYTLSNSIRRDVIVKFFLEKGIFDILRLNEVLFEKDEQPLGSF